MIIEIVCCKFCYTYFYHFKHYFRIDFFQLEHFMFPRTQAVYYVQCLPSKKKSYSSFENNFMTWILELLSSFCNASTSGYVNIVKGADGTMKII